MNHHLSRLISILCATALIESVSASAFNSTSVLTGPSSELKRIDFTEGIT